jgi:hypothetical protein
MCAELDHLRECDKASRKLIAELQAKLDRVREITDELERMAKTPPVNMWVLSKVKQYLFALGDEE